VNLLFSFSEKMFGKTWVVQQRHASCFRQLHNNTLAPNFCQLTIQALTSSRITHARKCNHTTVIIASVETYTAKETGHLKQTEQKGTS
jgi:hypothetical protein